MTYSPPESYGEGTLRTERLSQAISCEFFDNKVKKRSNQMLPRERVFAALEHREPDRIPWGISNVY